MSHQNQNNEHFCPACLSKLKLQSFQSRCKDYSLDGFTYSECQECLSIYLADDKVNSQNDLTQLHKKFWYQSRQFVFRPNRGGLEQVNDQADLVESLFHHCKINTHTKILDLGCGEGYLVAALHQKNCFAYGIDPAVNRFPVLEYFPKLRDYLGSGGIEDLQGKKKISSYMRSLLKVKFDLVVMNDVLEHLYDPTQALISISNLLLKNSGLIYIQIPSGESLQVKLLQEFAWNFMAPFHRSLFSKRGIEILAERIGAREVVFITNNRRNWGWTRGLAYKCGFSEEHSALRDSSALFRQYDYLIDDLLDTIALKYEAPPSIAAIFKF